jgi:hypothetical protein
MGVTPPQTVSDDVDHDLKTGRFISESTRCAQARWDNGNSLRVNLTKLGAQYHNVDDGQELSIMVFDEGIWVTTTSDDGQ